MYAWSSGTSRRNVSIIDACFHVPSLRGTSKRLQIALLPCCNSPFLHFATRKVSHYLLQYLLFAYFPPVYPQCTSTIALQDSHIASNLVLLTAVASIRTLLYWKLRLGHASPMRSGPCGSIPIRWSTLPQILYRTQTIREQRNYSGKYYVEGAIY
jgi:hypothetical protein